MQAALPHLDPNLPLGGVPERIGPYSVRGTAGRGNTGIVYLGFDEGARREVAIKVCLSLGGSGLTAGLARRLFHNEVQAAALLDHPNILQVLDTGEDEGLPYLVMDYVEGGQTLVPYCQPGALLAVETVARLAHACARALHHAHQRGVIHKDVKPGNLMLTREGVLKVVDFGIADIPHLESTEILGLLGSPRYMSPEQARGERLTGQTDLYSLGIVMYELLTGRTPFFATGLASLIEQVCGAEPTPVCALRPDVPEALEAVVMRAIGKDLARRYRTGLEIAADLAAAFAGLEAGDPGAPEPELVDRARRLRFFAELPEPAFAELVAQGAFRRCPPCGVIETLGGNDITYYVTVGGEVLVSSPAGVLARIGEGGCFGGIGRFDPATTAVCLVAAEDTVVYAIEGERLAQTSAECQLHFHRALSRGFVERLSTASEPPHADPAGCPTVRWDAPAPRGH